MTMETSEEDEEGRRDEGGRVGREERKGRGS
jgi:hypothetical protein